MCHHLNYERILSQKVSNETVKLDNHLILSSIYIYGIVFLFTTCFILSSNFLLWSKT